MSWTCDCVMLGASSERKIWPAYLLFCWTFCLWLPWLYWMLGISEKPLWERHHWSHYQCRRQIFGSHSLASLEDLDPPCRHLLTFNWKDLKPNSTDTIISNIFFKSHAEWCHACHARTDSWKRATFFAKLYIIRRSNHKKGTAISKTLWYSFKLSTWRTYWFKGLVKHHQTWLIVKHSTDSLLIHLANSDHVTGSLWIVHLALPTSQV